MNKYELGAAISDIYIDALIDAMSAGIDRGVQMGQGDFSVESYEAFSDRLTTVRQIASDRAWALAEQISKEMTK